LQDVAVIGHSMGGKVAMASALRDRRTIRRLVIVDIAPRTHPPDHAGIIEALSTLDIHNISDRKVADNALARRIPSLAVRQFLLKNLVRDNKIGFSWRMNLGAIRNAYDMIRGWPENEFSDTVDGRRPSNSLPALFVAGTKSNYILNEDRQQILGYFPNARFASIVSGHWIHAEAPGPFFEIVTEFLEESA